MSQHHISSIEDDGPAAYQLQTAGQVTRLALG